MHSNWHIFCILLNAVLLSIVPGRLQASPNLFLKSTDNELLTQYLEVFEDPSGRLAIEDIAYENPAIVFSALEGEQINRGYSQSIFWLRFSVNNRSEIQNWLISADNPLLQFTAYVKNGQAPIRSYVPESRISLAAEIDLPKQTTSMIYLRVHSVHIVDLNFRLINQREFESQITNKVSFLAAYVGLAVALFLYNGFVYLALRDRNYLYYLLFAAVNTHLNLMAAGFPADIFNFLGLDWWLIGRFYRPLAPLTLFLFTRALFRTPLAHPKLDKVLIAYMAGLFLIMLSNFFLDRTLVFQIEDPYFFFGIFLSFCVGIASLRKKSGPSIYYILALSAFTIGIGIYLGAVQNLIPTNFFTLSAHMIGHSCELVIMSLVLARNMKALHDELVTLSYERKIAVAQYSKLSSLGMMAGGLSHEISNPLAIVMGQLQVAKMHVNRGNLEQLKLRMASAYESCERIQKIIQAVRNLYVGSHLPGDKLCRLDETVATVLNQFQDRIRREHVRVELDITPSLSVKAHPTHMEIVLRILVDNALDALQDAPRKSLKISGIRTPDSLILSVADKGKGMSEETKQRIFDPFFTTKGSGQGMGLGLTLVHTIVNSYSWTIQVESEAGKTLFSMIIPLTAVQSLSPRVRTARTGEASAPSNASGIAIN